MGTWCFQRGGNLVARQGALFISCTIVCWWFYLGSVSDRVHETSCVHGGVCVHIITIVLLVLCYIFSDIKIIMAAPLIYFYDQYLFTGQS
jgi:hypothetical protein